jgi:hypothetical protein
LDLRADVGLRRIDLTGSLTLNASAVPVSIGQRGQVARYTVALPAGQVTVRLTNNGIGSTTVTLLKPDGSLVPIAMIH